MDQSHRINWLFDVEQIKRLKHRYCSYCDQDYDAEGIASLFTTDGVWDGGDFGKATGRDEIRSFFSGASDRTLFANHYVTNPIIDVSGDFAHGKWDLWQPMVRGPEPRALWLMAKYRETYVRSASDWLIQSLKLDVRALSPYEKGFAQQRFL